MALSDAFVYRLGYSGIHIENAWCIPDMSITMMELVLGIAWNKMTGGNKGG